MCIFGYYFGLFVEVVKKKYLFRKFAIFLKGFTVNIQTVADRTKIFLRQFLREHESSFSFKGPLTQEWNNQHVWIFFWPLQIFGNSSHRDVCYIFEATTHLICIKTASKCDKIFIFLNYITIILIFCVFPRNLFVF